MRRSYMRRTRMSRKAKPNRYNTRERDYDYMAFVRELPCCRCHSLTRKAEAHHSGDRAYGRIAPDRTVIPLCRSCHQGISKLNEFPDKAARREWVDEMIAQTQSQYLSSKGQL